MRSSESRAHHPHRGDIAHGEKRICCLLVGLLACTFEYDGGELPGGVSGGGRSEGMAWWIGSPMLEKWHLKRSENVEGRRGRSGGQITSKKLALHSGRMGGGTRLAIALTEVVFRKG